MHCCDQPQCAWVLHACNACHIFNHQSHQGGLCLSRTLPSETLVFINLVQAFTQPALYPVWVAIHANSTHSLVCGVIIGKVCVRALAPTGLHCWHLPDNLVAVDCLTMMSCHMQALRMCRGLYCICCFHATLTWPSVSPASMHS